MRHRTDPRNEAELVADIVAAIVGTCSVVALAIVVAMATSALIAFLLWVLFAASGAQRQFFSMVARPLRRIVKSRTAFEQEDMGYARRAFKARRSVPLVIDHDPHEFSRKRA